MHPCNTDKYCFGHLPPPCTTSPTPQLRAHLRLLVVMIFAKGERNCTGRTVSEHLANRKAGKAHNKHAQMLTFSVARSPVLQFLGRTHYFNFITSATNSVLGALLYSLFNGNANYRFASSVTALSHFAFAVQKSPRLAMYFQQPDVPGKFIRHSVPSSAMSCIQYTTSSARLSASDLTS